MRYIISDIHGCYKQYQNLLEEINFSDDDHLYVLGDAMDRGPEPIKVMQDIMARENVTYILGNHDYVFLELITQLREAEGLSEKEQRETIGRIEEYLVSSGNGEGVTILQYLNLKRADQNQIINYLRSASVYEVLQHDEEQYVLVHAGIEDFVDSKSLDAYDDENFVFGRPDYSKRYYADENIHVVTGHTPTPLIREDRNPIIYTEHGHIAIDCGCVFGGLLAAYCIEEEDAYYVDGYHWDEN